MSMWFLIVRGGILVDKFKEGDRVQVKGTPLTVYHKYADRTGTVQEHLNAHALGTEAVYRVLLDGEKSYHGVNFFSSELTPLQDAPSRPVEAPLADFHTNLDHLYQEAAKTLLNKHSDYGPNNISDSPGGALNGLRVRMHDKMARINHLIDNNADPRNEPLRDSFVDLLGYSTIGLMVLDGTWPGTERPAK